MNTKLTKIILKATVGFAISAAIGYTMKVEKQIEQRIDEHFDSPEN